MTPADFGFDDPWMMRAAMMAAFLLVFAIGTRR